VYDALVRMAQPFSLRYPLIDGQGNFGSVDGDPPAAMRYTEARMSQIAAEMVADIDKDTVDFVDNYTAEKQEPSSCGAHPEPAHQRGDGDRGRDDDEHPAPQPPRGHSGVTHLLENEEATSEDLMRFVRGPDFPTGGLIMGRAGIVQAYATGHGKIIVRARHTFEEAANGRERIIIDELPYAVNKANLVAKIADLVSDRKLDGIADLRDESDRQGCAS